MRRALARSLGARGVTVELARDGRSALELVQTRELDVVLLDVMLPDVDGLEVLERIKSLAPTLEVVMMTAFGDVGVALESVRRGAYHFLQKPFRSDDEVVVTLRNAAEKRRLATRTLELEREVSGEGDFAELVGSSRAMQAVYQRALAVAPTSSTVLLFGESGTGKELTARAIHRNSSRSPRALVTVNCSAIPPELVESELFGHVKGAFTGATATRPGLFDAASGGTLFLDEIGDLPLHAQVKLLRVLQQGEIKPVGSNEVRTVDVRVIAATHLDLRSMIHAGAFREDLYYRLAVVTFKLPPLRERREDIPPLAQHFLLRCATKAGRRVRRFSADALDALCRHPWPGNVRELENAIEHGVIFCTGEEMRVADLPIGVAPTSSLPPPLPPSGADAPTQPYKDARAVALEEFERRYFRALLEETNGNLSSAARLAGLDRSNLKRALRRAGLRE
ncbi:MAG: sigma-54-dependent Fis family transcriptional regulator [Polyangiaceae bacterium]|nr:sigma-54-dependent Fis family transcriptional regulator [Polyangiaceae bacterium]